MIDLKLFIGHKKPSFPIWPGFEFFGDWAAQIEQASQTMAPALLDGKQFSEYTDLFLIKHWLDQQGIDNGRITICQHRRFVFSQPFGLPTLNQEFSRYLTSAQVMSFDAGAYAVPKNGDFLIPSVFDLPAGMSSQYMECHHGRDLMRFCADLVDHGLMPENLLFEFLNSNQIVPSGSCGTYPIEAFKIIMGHLEKAALMYVNSDYPKRSGIQRRVIAFLLERLNSYLVMRYFYERGMDYRKYAGFTTVITENGFLVPNMGIEKGERDPD